jgi:xanthine dehydrogenase accessory factor
MLLKWNIHIEMYFFGEKWRNQVEDLYEILDVVIRSDKSPLVIATIIKVEGSSYKKEGSSMLFLVNHSKVGMITAGCLEEELAERAKQVWEIGEPCTVRYDMSSEDDLSWGQGAGCNGVLTVLLEPVKDELIQNLFTLKECLDAKKIVTRIIQFTKEFELKEDLYVVDDGTSFGSGDINHDYVKNLIKRRKSYEVEKGIKTIEQSTDIFFINQIVPKPCLYLFGAGEDARPLVSLAARTGFKITVIDWRPALCNKEYFPNAEQFILGTPEEVMKRLTFTPMDFVVIMTHQFQKDQYFLTSLAKEHLFYLGILGPKRRTERLLGFSKVPESIHSPIGLSIGAKGAEEIAISIVGEMIDKMRNPRKYSL